MNAHRAEAAAAFDAPALRAAARTRDRRAARRHRRRACVRARRARLAGGRGRARAIDSTSRRAMRRGRRTPRRGAHGIGAACCSARRASSTSCGSCRWSRSRTATCPRSSSISHHALRHRDGFALTDAGHGPRRRARRGALLHLVPRAGQGLVLARTAREEAGRRKRSGESVQAHGVRRDAGGLPARGEDLRVPEAAARRAGRSVRSR